MKVVENGSHNILGLQIEIKVGRKETLQLGGDHYSMGQREIMVMLLSEGELKKVKYLKRLLTWRFAA